MSRPNELTEALEATRKTLRKGGFDDNAPNPNVDRQPVLYSRPMSERQANMHARLTRIMESIDPASSIEKAIAGAEYRQLAHDFASVFMHFMTRGATVQLTDRPNPFRYLTDEEANRKCTRMLEDICDRSTGKMGPWTNGISVTASARR